MDTECPICKTDMGLPMFEKATEDVCTDTCIRLRCGHAFHGTCLAMSLRNAHTKCPLCRDDPEEDTADVPFLDELTTRIGEIDASVRQRTYVQTHDTNVQRERRRLNEYEREFNALEERLKHERHVRLSVTLKDFRKEYRAKFDKVRKRIQRQLTKVRSMEWRALDTIYGTDAATNTIAILDASGVYDSLHRLGPREALRKSFWTL